MKHNQLTHRFVRAIPKEVEPGILYVSMEYATAIHACCCGCGNQVVTPFSPTDWQIIFNGESISLSPSIGNWSFPCQSHYFIKNGKVIVAESWSSSRISAGRDKDHDNKAKHYKNNLETHNVKEKSLLAKFYRWMFGGD